MPVDVAHFRADDCEDLVLASLACPICLYSSSVDWEVLSDGYDASVACECRRCGHGWWVYANPWQALRLELMAARAG
jgi:uncharacterized Zn finger protein